MSIEKVTVGFIVIGTLVISALAFYISRESPELVRLVVNVGLCWALARGRSWARWTTGVLHALAGIFGLIASSEASGATSTPLFFMGLFYVVAAFLLLSGVLVRKYFEAPEAAQDA